MRRLVVIIIMVFLLVGCMGSPVNQGAESNFGPYRIVDIGGEPYLFHYRNGTIYKIVKNDQGKIEFEVVGRIPDYR